MAVRDEIVLRTEFDLQEELDELRRNLLPMFLIPLLGTSWAWFGYATATGQAPGFSEGAVIVSLVAGIFVKHIGLATGVLGHEGSALLVVLNGMRLLKERTTA